MIVTKRESMASLIHDTSPILRHSLQQSHNKGLYYGFRDAIYMYFFNNDINYIKIGLEAQ